MSWDVLIVKASDPNYIKPAEGAQFLSMGTAQEVREKITTAIPAIEWSSSSEGHGLVGSLSFEFTLMGHVEKKSVPSAPKRPGVSDLVESVGVSVRGAGEPLSVLVSIAKANKWSIADAQEGSWVDLSAPSQKSWKEFTEFRDHATGSTTGEPVTSSNSVTTNLLISAVVFGVVAIAVRYLFK